MHFLLLTIILHALIFSLFKLFGRQSINTFQAIVVNYFVCVITGSLFAGPSNVLNAEVGTWTYTALALGLVFISTFYMMALTSQKISMAASSIASKMSLAIPVLFSLFVLKVESDMNWINYIGICLALPATYLSSKSSSGDGFQLKLLWLPLAIFFLNGFIDVVVNYSSLNLLRSNQLELFPIFAFLSAAVIGGTILLIQGKIPNSKTLIAGITLGVINYFSVYVLFLALDNLNNNGALVFPIFNTGIIVLTSAIGLVFFKEDLNWYNKIGILVSVLAIILIVL